MAGEKKPTPGVSSRRSACDRCRGQKLRCLRKGGDPQGRCDRCAKADTSCTTSPIYRMRNYSVEDDGSSVSRKRRRIGDRCSVHPSQSPRIAASATANAATPLTPSGPDAQTISPPVSLTIPTVAQTTPTTSGSTQPFQWHFGDAVQGSSNDGTMGVHFAMQPTPANWSSFSDAATPALSTPVVTSANIWEHHDLSMAHIYTAANTDKTTTTSFNSPAGESMPQNNFSATHAYQVLQLQQPHAQESMHWSQQQAQHEYVSDYFTHEDSNTRGMMGYAVSDLESRSHTHMEMLTSINLKLITQLRQVTLPHTNINVLINHPTAGNPEPCTTSTFERILNLTQEFINILDVIVGSPHTSHVPRTPLATEATPIAWIGGVYGGYASGSEGASTSAYDSEINSPSESSNTTQYSPASASMSPQVSSPATYFDNDMATPTAKPTTDSASVLLIITCYVHILRLHVVLFWHLQQDLEPTSDGDNMHGVCRFGNLPLRTCSFNSLPSTIARAASHC